MLEHCELEQRRLVFQNVGARARQLGRPRDIDQVELLAQRQVILEVEIEFRELDDAA